MLSIKTNINGNIIELEHGGSPREIASEIEAVINSISGTYLAAGDAKAAYRLAVDIEETAHVIRTRALEVIRNAE